MNQRKKPNVLLIIVDDLGYADASAAPQAAEEVHTSNIDCMANMGM